MEKQNKTRENVAVVGASAKVDRYSNRAIRMLLDAGHNVFPILPSGSEIYGQKGFKSLLDVQENIDTVTVYLGVLNQNHLSDELLKIKPKRVIFNPGTENVELYGKLQAADIKYVEACTLVLLSIGTF
jgi:uncharacterized protein